MNLTLLTTIKGRLGIPEHDPVDDEFLTLLIRVVSARFQRHCNRDFDRQADTTDEFAADSTELILNRYPIESVSAFAVKANETDGWQTESDVDYLIQKSGKGAACIVSLANPLGAERERLRVTYTGGYVLPGAEVGAGQTALPDDIEGAAIEQIVYLYQNKNKLGLSSISGDGGSIAMLPVSVVKPLDLLPSVKNALEPHIRWRL